MALAACSPGEGDKSLPRETVTSPSGADSSTTLPPETTTTQPAPVGVPTDFARAVIEVDGIPYNVAVADSPDELSRGLMGVEQLSPLDGMLFVYDAERLVSHWMKDTLIPLDIAFFDGSGALVSVTSMGTCLDGDCPSYASEGPARYAVEVPLGGFARLSPDARLVIIGALEGVGKEI